jgi:hypothetical protein
MECQEKTISVFIVLSNNLMDLNSQWSRSGVVDNCGVIKFALPLWTHMGR